MVKRASWLSITPEPERELPRAVATMAAGRHAAPAAVASERERIERLILRGSQRRWLAYLHGVVDLIAAEGNSRDPDVAAARQRAIAVIVNHHHLLLGLPDYDPTHPKLTANDLSRLRALASRRPHEHDDHAVGGPRAV